MKQPFAAFPRRIFAFCATITVFLIVLLYSSCNECPDCSNFDYEAKCGGLQDNVIEDEWIIRFAEGSSVVNSLDLWQVITDDQAGIIISLDSFLLNNSPGDIADPANDYTLVGWSQDLLDQLNQHFFRDASGNPAQLIEEDVIPIRTCGCRMATFWINPIKVDLQSSITQSTSQTRTQDDGSSGEVTSVDMNRQVSFGPLEDITTPNDNPLSCIKEIDDEEPDKINTYCETGLSVTPPKGPTNAAKVAVIDSGMDWLHDWMGNGARVWVNHEEGLGGQVSPGLSLVDDWPNRLKTQPDRNCFENDFIGYDFIKDTNVPIDRQGHGTHVGGIIAKAHPEVTNLELMPLKIAGFVEENGQEVFTADLFSVLCAMEYAIEQEVSVINMSLGYYAESPNQQLIQLTNRALSSDILIVASVGNDEINVDCCGHWPSNLAADNSFPNVISVAALDKITQLNGYAQPSSLASFSNYGNKALIAAPGVSINSATIGGADQLITKSGTSMAAAIISQQAAIIRASQPGLSAPDVRTLMLGPTYSDFAPGDYCNQLGRYYRYNGKSEIKDLLPSN